MRVRAQAKTNKPKPGEVERFFLVMEALEICAEDHEADEAFDCYEDCAEHEAGVAHECRRFCLVNRLFMVAQVMHRLGLESTNLADLEGELLELEGWHLIHSEDPDPDKVLDVSAIQ